MPPTPNEVYNDNQIPAGSGYVDVYRGVAAPAKLGTYLFESMDPTPAGIFTDRPATDGGDNGWKLVNGRKEGSATFQRATGVTPSLKNGDFFKTSLIEVDNAGVAVTEIYVIASPAQPTGVGYRVQSATVRRSNNPPAAVLAIAEYVP